MTTNKRYNLTELQSKFIKESVTTLQNYVVDITLDDKHDISLIELLVHDGNEYFSMTNNATGFNESYWITDSRHTVTISAIRAATTEDSSSVDSSGVDYFLSTEDATTIAINPDHENLVSKLENLDIDAIADLCADLSSIQIMELIGKLSKIAAKNSKSENKKIKVNKPEKTQVFITKKVSDKNFAYFDLLSNWYNSALSAREIAADSALSSGYGAATIAEDMRVIKVLLGGDKLVQISKEWCDYIINYWSENSDTTWVRLHYAFSKDGRKCNDLDILCNYVIDNGVTKEDVKNAIAFQN